MQGQEDTGLTHVLAQALFHLGKKLPEGLEQGEVTDVTRTEGPKETGLLGMTSHNPVPSPIQQEVTQGELQGAVGGGGC